jgi:hypothetical protein
MTSSELSQQLLASKPSPQAIPETREQLAELLRRSVGAAVSEFCPPDRVWRRIERAVRDPQESKVKQRAEKVCLD